MPQCCFPDSARFVGGAYMMDEEGGHMYLLVLNQDVLMHRLLLERQSLVSLPKRLPSIAPSLLQVKDDEGSFETWKAFDLLLSSSASARFSLVALCCFAITSCLSLATTRYLRVG